MNAVYDARIAIDDFYLLSNAAMLIEKGNFEEASFILKPFIQKYQTTLHHGADLKKYIFASSLLRRINEKQNDFVNIYLKQFDINQIDLFNLMGKAFPFVTLANEIANNIIAETTAGNEHFTLVDIGIGTGRQIVSLLPLLHTNQNQLKKITIIGIEPNADNLRKAGEAICKAATHCHVEVNWIPINKKMEDLADEEWLLLKKSKNIVTIQSS